MFLMDRKETFSDLIIPVAMCQMCHLLLHCMTLIMTNVSVQRTHNIMIHIITCIDFPGNHMSKPYLP